MIQSATFKKKTAWAGVASIVAGIGLWYEGDVVQGLNLIVMGILAIVGRDAITKLGV